MSSYGGFNWKGFTCDDKPFAKRSDLTPRTFGNKYVGGSCKADKASSPSFGCGSSPDVDKFSISVIDIVVEFDVDLELHYDMPDGSACKQRSSCSKSGSSVKNSQCGGAKNVTIIMPPQPSKPKPSCSIGVHSISFDCSPPKVTKTFTTSTTTRSTSTTTTSTTTSTSSSSSSSSLVYVSSVLPVTTSAPPALTTSTVFETVVQTITKCGPNIHNCPGGNGTVVVTTVTIAVSTTVCPVTESSSLPEATSSEAPLPATTTSYYVPPPPPPPKETLGCPDVVPKCLNTWIFVVGCKDNTDHGCYCPSQVFVENIFTCIFAYGETDVIISQAVSFFQGICAPYVPQNPCIATGAKTVTDVLTVTATPPPLASVVYTTVTVDVTTVEPCETGLTTYVVPSAITVPQVDFSTNSADQVGLVPATTPLVAEVGGPKTTFTITGPAPVATGGFTPTGPPRAVFTGAAGQTRAGWVVAGAAAFVGAVALL